jgi:hypothetical protein
MLTRLLVAAAVSAAMFGSLVRPTEPPPCGGVLYPPTPTPGQNSVIIGPPLCPVVVQLTPTPCTPTFVRRCS